MIKRAVHNQIRDHLRQKEMTILIGPRQVGKTTLMSQLKEELEYDNQKVLYFNLDIQNDAQYFVSQSTFIQRIQEQVGNNKAYIFADEIQRVPNAGLFLKGIYDMDLPYKFILSGSGSLELKEKIPESMAGRKRMIKVLPLSFEEFVNYRTLYGYEHDIQKFFTLEQENSLTLLKEYLNYGGYPRVVTASTSTIKLQIIEEIFQSYIDKDIKNILNVEKTESFSNLIRILSSQLGTLINMSEIAGFLNLSEPTVKNYLWYLQQTFVIEKIRPLYRNYQKELRKMPIPYFFDLGMRNYAIDRLGNISSPPDFAYLFQNFIFHIVKEKIELSNRKIKFWRTQDGAEVDLVVDSVLDTIPIEVKFSNLKSAEISRSFRSYIEKYKPKKGYIINLSLEAKIFIGTTEVEIIPYYKFLQTTI